MFGLKRCWGGGQGGSERGAWPALCTPLELILMIRVHRNLPVLLLVTLGPPMQVSTLYRQLSWDLVSWRSSRACRALNPLVPALSVLMPRVPRRHRAGSQTHGMV